MQSGRSSGECQLKLTKRDKKPVLCYESSCIGLSVDLDLVHDIPIKLLKVSDGVYHHPPAVNPPSVALDLPQASQKQKLLKTVLTAMTKLSKFIHITAIQSGQIIIKAETSSSSAQVKTYFTSLQPRFVGDLNPDLHMENIVVVKVNPKHLSNVLNLANLSYETGSIFITPGEAVLVHVTLEPYTLGSLTYYLPVMVLNEGEDVSDENN